jgi:hypothetical protein
MPIKKVAHRAKMVKKGSNKMALKWVPSSFEKPDLKKAKKEGFLPEAMPVIFPGDERVPTPPKGYRAMFLAFLLCGLSLPAHEFLRGLLFVYGVQLHQLTPNSILHIACFITLCESFLGIDPHWVLWKFLFCLRPSVSLDKNPELGGELLYLCDLNRITWSSTWLPRCKDGGKNGSISRTRRQLPLISMVFLLLMPTKI